MIYERGTPLGLIGKHEFYLAESERKARFWDSVKESLKKIVKKSKKVNGTHSTVPTVLIEKLERISRRGER